MRSTTWISLGLSLMLALIAVLGMRSYLADQRDLLGQQGGVAPKALNTIVVASQPMRFGKLVEPTSLKVIDWPAATVPEGAFRTIDEVIGDSGKQRYVMAAIEKDEPVLTSKITGPGQRATLSASLGPDMKAVSIRVNDVLGVAGFVLPGDRVDVMLTRERKDKDGNNTSYIDVLLQGVRVLAVDQSADDRSDKPSVVKTVTFEVSTTEAQKLALASSVGTLSLALRNIASSGVEDVRQLNASDLDSGAASKALADAQAKADADDRLTNIERLVRKVGENIGKPIIIRETVPAAAEELPQPEPVAVVPEPPKNVVTVVGVTRNGARTEYQVRPIGVGEQF